MRRIRYHSIVQLKYMFIRIYLRQTRRNVSSEIMFSYNTCLSFFSYMPKNKKKHVSIYPGKKFIVTISRSLQFEYTHLSGIFFYIAWPLVTGIIFLYTRVILPKDFRIIRFFQLNYLNYTFEVAHENYICSYLPIHLPIFQKFLCYR